MVNKFIELVDGSSTDESIQFSLEVLTLERRRMVIFAAVYLLLEVGFLLLEGIGQAQFEISQMGQKALWIHGFTALVYIAFLINTHKIWFEILLILICSSEMLDFYFSTKPLLDLLVFVLILTTMSYVFRNYINLILPFSMSFLVLMGLNIWRDNTFSENALSIVFIMMLMVVMLFNGREHFIEKKKLYLLKKNQKMLLDEFKLLNNERNGELLKQSVHLMNIEEAEAKFRVLTTSIDAAIFLLNEEGRVTFSNKWLKSAYGFEYDSFQTIDDFSKVLSEADYEMLVSAYRATFKLNEPVALKEVQIVLPNEEKIWLKVKLSVVRTSQSKNIMVAGFDITERKQIELKIKNLSEIKDVLLSLSPSMLMRMELGEVFEYVLENIMLHIEHADLSCILMLKDQEMVMQSSRGYNEVKAKTFKLNYKDTYVYHATKGNFTKPVILNELSLNYSKDFTRTLDSNEERMIESSLCTPIFVDNQLFGMINMDSYLSDVFTKNDQEIMSFVSEQLAVAITNQKLLKLHQSSLT